MNSNSFGLLTLLDFNLFLLEPRALPLIEPSYLQSYGLPTFTSHSRRPSIRNNLSYARSDLYKSYPPSHARSQCTIQYWSVTIPYFPRQMSLPNSGGFLALAIAVYYWITKYYSGAIIFTIIAVFGILAYFGMRSRIPLASLMLQVSLCLLYYFSSLLLFSNDLHHRSL